MKGLSLSPAAVTMNIHKLFLLPRPNFDPTRYLEQGRLFAKGYEPSADGLVLYDAKIERGRA